MAPPLGARSDFGNDKEIVAGAKGNVPSHRYEVEPIDVDAEDDEHSEHRLRRRYAPSVEGRDVSPLEALRSKPRASFNKSFRKANEMLRVLDGRT